jgi:mannose-6-phosphate isomerase-like protein (cupin superfamily)
MKRRLLKLHRGFRVAIGNKRCQLAEMAIPSGDAEGGPHNRHHGADQCLYVVSGVGFARINGRRYKLSKGVALLIEKGEQHEIRNTGRALLRTINFYSPPAYSRQGDPLPPAKP